MKNKNTLIITATAMICIAVACVFAVVVLTAPVVNNNADNGSKDVVADFSVDTSLGGESSVESSLSSEWIEDSVISEEEKAPELILPPDTVIYSQIAVVYDVVEDEVVFSRDADVQTPPASLTKLVTAMVALEHLSPTRRVTVGEEINMIGENSSVAFLAVGQKYTVKSLIDGLLIPSGNDAAYVLAVNAARTAANDMNLSLESAVSDFVRLMNEKVKSLGCFNTRFSTPDGYDADGQVTTAMDMVKICTVAANNTYIKESVAKSKSGGWINSNLLVREDSSLYNECVTGLKTGSTSGAGYCVSVSAIINDKAYIMVFMNSQSSYGRFKDANTIIDLIKDDEQDNSSEEESSNGGLE